MRLQKIQSNKIIMKKNILLLAILINSIPLLSQKSYFPPKGSWEVKDPSAFGIDNKKISNIINKIFLKK